MLDELTRWLFLPNDVGACQYPLILRDLFDSKDSQ